MLGEVYKIVEVLRDRIKCSGIISVSIIFGIDISNILYDMLPHKQPSLFFCMLPFFFLLSCLSAYGKRSFRKIQVCSDYANFVNIIMRYTTVSLLRACVLKIT